MCLHECDLLNCVVTQPTLSCYSDLGDHLWFEKLSLPILIFALVDLWTGLDTSIYTVLITFDLILIAAARPKAPGIECTGHMLRP